MTTGDDLKRIRRKPDLLDVACDHEVLVYSAGLCLVLVAIGMWMLWR